MATRTNTRTGSAPYTCWKQSGDVHSLTQLSFSSAGMWAQATFWHSRFRAFHPLSLWPHTHTHTHTRTHAHTWRSEGASNLIEAVRTFACRFCELVFASTHDAANVININAVAARPRSMLTRMVAAVGQLSADTEPRVCVFAEEPMPALSTYVFCV